MVVVKDKSVADRSYGLIVVHYEKPRGIRGILESVPSWIDRPSEIIIVDNSRSLSEEHLVDGIPVTVITPPENIGFGSAINLGFYSFRFSHGQFLVLSHEVRMRANTTRMMLDSLISVPQAAVVGPSLRYLSKPGVFFSLGGEISRNGVASHIANGRESIPRGMQDIQEVDWVDGSCQLIKAEVFERLGGFDPFYFMYVEEVDFHTRARLAGNKIIINRLAEAWQEPGNYLWRIKAKNSQYFTKKFDSLYAPWPSLLMSLRHGASLLRKFLLALLS